MTKNILKLTSVFMILDTRKDNLYYNTCGHDDHEAWMKFFHVDHHTPGAPYRLPLATAIEAYELLGFKCIELELKRKK